MINPPTKYPLLRRFLALLALGSLLAAFATAGEEPKVHFYNWSNYIADNTLPDFTRQTGIAVTYDTFDSNEMLEAKLLAGKTGFDLVVPSADFFSRQIKAGVFQELDRSKIPNHHLLDSRIMKRLQAYDPDNKYGVPYMWGSTGIGYNVEKVRSILGENAPTDSWDLIFKPENISRLAQCGVAFTDDPTEIFALALHYLGKNPASDNPKDYSGAATQLLLKIRPYITYFHSSKFIQDLANGNICVAVAYSGDVLQARDNAREASAEPRINIAYSLPREGSIMWFELLAIPKDAKHPDNAHKLINYLLEPQVAANNTNEVAYANPVPSSKPFVKPAINADPGVYPPEEMVGKLFSLKTHSQNVARTITRSWTRVRTGQ